MKTTSIHGRVLHFVPIQKRNGTDDVNESKENKEQEQAQQQQHTGTTQTEVEMETAEDEESSSSDELLWNCFTQSQN